MAQAKIPCPVCRTSFDFDDLDTRKGQGERLWPDCTRPDCGLNGGVTPQREPVKNPYSA